MGGQVAVSGTDKRVGGRQTRVTFYEEENEAKRERFFKELGPEAAAEAEAAASSGRPDESMGHAFGDSGRWIDGQDARTLEKVRGNIRTARTVLNAVARRQSDGRCEAAIGDVADALGALTDDLTDILTN